MKFKIAGCITILFIALGQCAYATVNADGSLSHSSSVPPVSKPADAPRNPFSGGDSISVLTPATVSVTLTLNSGELLSQGIKTWAEQAGYKLLWQSKNDYLIYSHIALVGNNEDEVLTELGKLFSSENYGLIIKNYQKNHVFIIDCM